ncbi:uncharacterized protein [Rutidosis leptorrhynchoides]|uniref:uncharacterized protein n=1 Tax=Rutidosis leptorrhynchoides TaxID=125765 RepID=UPI003A995B4A
MPRGITANPKKIQAVDEMLSQRTKKDVQSLNRNLAVLSRFLSKAAERSLPFFLVLKACIGKSFNWTSEAENDFQDMKALIKTLPTLMAPVSGETLTVYLAAGAEAISLVLIAELDGTQMSVYFVSNILQHGEVNYNPVEKLVYALVHTARRLRRYFQAHHILVLSKPKISEWMAKWAIELGEHEISYAPRNAIKGQIMVDFMVEFINSGPPTAANETAPQTVTWELYTDRASSSDGAGAGLILRSPDGEEHTYTLRFAFSVSNNEAEYEALLSGLRIAEKMGIKAPKVAVDSQLVANQVNGSFEARDPEMQKYLKLAEELANKFDSFSITQVPRSMNKKADALSKLASLTFSHFAKDVWVEVVNQKSTDVVQVAAPVEEVNTWMNPIVDYLKDGTLPADSVTAKKVGMKAPMYVICDGVLYEKSFLGPLLHCVGPQEAETVIREVHEGTCGMHSRFRTVLGKIMRLGYYWSSMYRDTSDRLTFLQNGLNFIWEEIVCRFGVPHDIVSDNGKYFAHDPFRAWCERLNIKQTYCSVTHPQANGQVEVTNRDIVSGIRGRLDMDRKGWEDELPMVLWAFRTTPKGSNRETPFSLVYSSEVVIPAEIAVPTQCVMEFSEEANMIQLRENMDLLEERRCMTAIRKAANKQKIAKYYNRRVRERSFRPGDYVWRNNNASRVEDLGKLGPNWEGPYEVVGALGNGAYNLKTPDGKFVPRTWHATNLKKFYV